MKVNLAQSAGFCAGVKRAVQLALKDAALFPGRIFMLGDIVHNAVVVDKLQRAGIKVVKSLSQIPRGSTILIRAHGSRPSVYRAARRRGLRIVDATCPMVAEIHHQAIKLQKAGLTVAIIGDAKHDEVLGIAGELKHPFILSREEDVEKLPRSTKKIGLVVQSTQSLAQVKKIVSALLDRFADVRLINTICAPTLAHQREIYRLPGENDAIVIVGSRKSANTKRLFEIAASLNHRTYWIETASDLKRLWFKGVKKIGVTAGASTPDEVIKKVVTTLKGY